MLSTILAELSLQPIAGLGAALGAALTPFCQHKEKQDERNEHPEYQAKIGRE